MLLELESCFESDIEPEGSDEELEISDEEELGDEFTKLQVKIDSQRISATLVTDDKEEWENPFDVTGSYDRVF